MWSSPLLGYVCGRRHQPAPQKGFKARVRAKHYASLERKSHAADAVGGGQWEMWGCVWCLGGGLCFPSGATVLPTFNVAQMSQTQFRGAAIENSPFFFPTPVLLFPKHIQCVVMT